MFSFSHVLFASSLFVGSFGQKRASDSLASEITALRQANTAIDRYAILGNDGFSFSFLDAESVGGGGKDGQLVLADNTNFPAVIETGSAMLMGFIGPCGMLAPHIHPRATEILVNVGGPPLMIGIIPEEGAPVVIGYAGAGNVTILPQGSVHYIANTGCYPAIVVSGFNHESPGAMLVSQAFAAFDEQTYSAAFGEAGVTMIDSSQIPNLVNIGRRDCLEQCGIDANTFDISSTTKSELLKQAFEGYLEETKSSS